jgi:hypothetical protein
VIASPAARRLFRRLAVRAVVTVGALRWFWFVATAKDVSVIVPGTATLVAVGSFAAALAVALVVVGRRFRVVEDGDDPEPTLDWAAVRDEVDDRAAEITPRLERRLPASTVLTRRSPSRVVMPGDPRPPDRFADPLEWLASVLDEARQ